MTYGRLTLGREAYSGTGTPESPYVPPEAEVVEPEIVGTAGAGTASSAHNYVDVAYPAGIQAGDELLAWHSCDDSYTLNTPSGWTLMRSVVSSQVRMNLYRKEAVGTESGTTQRFTQSSAWWRQRAIIVAVRGGVLVGSASSTAAGGAVASGALTPATEKAIWFGCYAGGSAASGSTVSITGGPTLVRGLAGDWQTYLFGYENRPEDVAQQYTGTLSSGSGIVSIAAVIEPTVVAYDESNLPAGEIVLASDTEVTANVSLAKREAVHYIDLNVGFSPTAKQEAVHYIDLNVGFSLTAVADAVHYIDLGDVDTSTPVPHIWFVDPDAGDYGTTFRIVGHGFGASEVTYLGQVQASDEDNFVVAGVTAWEVLGSAPIAADPNRKIEPGLELGAEIVGLEYQQITVTVPYNVGPGPVQIKVVTDGP